MPLDFGFEFRELRAIDALRIILILRDACLAAFDIAEFPEFAIFILFAACAFFEAFIEDADLRGAVAAEVLIRAASDGAVRAIGMAFVVEADHAVVAAHLAMRLAAEDARRIASRRAVAVVKALLVFAAAHAILATALAELAFSVAETFFGAEHVFGAACHIASRPAVIALDRAISSGDIADFAFETASVVADFVCAWDARLVYA